ncbi:nucleotide-diphospho-sugar transferase [Trichoderma chlorosporum]
MLPDPETNDAGGSHDGEMMIKARDGYGVKLMPVEIQHRDTVDDTWANSYTKLLAFNLVQYERVIAIDADVTILKHMDELFHLPPCPVAMPRTYWLLDDAHHKRALSSHIMVIQPDKREFERIQKRIQLADKDEYDMELLNELYADTAMVLPHRPYALLSSEFRETEHHLYLGSETEEWDPVAVMNEAKTVHFSDFPVPKPWKVHLTTGDRDNIVNLEPKCGMKKNADDGDKKEKDCSGRDVWRELYADFRERKARVCARKPWLIPEDVKYKVSKDELGGLKDVLPYVEPDDDANFLSM